MGKKEQMEKETKLQELENAILGNFSFNNGSLFKAAESLLVVDKTDLFKAVRKEGKMAYRTFKAYLDHFELNAENRRLLEKLITFHEFLVDRKFEEIVPQLPTTDDFWAAFMKIKPEYWVDVIKAFKKIRYEISIDDVESFLNKTPEAKVGYSAARKLPTPVQNILANAKKIGEAAEAEFARRMTDTDEAGVKNLFKALSSVKEAMDNSTIIAIPNSMLEESNDFSIAKIDGKATAVRLAKRRKTSNASVTATFISVMLVGYGLGRLVEFIISKLV